MLAIFHKSILGLYDIHILILAGHPQPACRLQQASILSMVLYICSMFEHIYLLEVHELVLVESVYVIKEERISSMILRSAVPYQPFSR